MTDLFRRLRAMRSYLGCTPWRLGRHDSGDYARFFLGPLVFVWCTAEAWEDADE